MFSRLKIFKEVLCPQKYFFCAFLFAGSLHAHKSSVLCLNALRTESGTEYSHSIHTDENFIRVGDSTVRLAPNVGLHTVVFDFFGSDVANFARTENKLVKLNGAEAFSPIAKFKSDSDAAEWMAQRLREVQGRNFDHRPVVAYVRGDMAAAAALLSQNHPDLVQGLVIENPLSSAQTTVSAETPDWTTNSFRVPTFILTGTHDAKIPTLQKQKLYDLTKEQHLKREEDPSLAGLHYMDMPFGTEDVFASTAKNLAHEEANHFIRRYVLKDPSIDEHTVAPNEFVRLAQTAGIGPRRFLGHNPKVTPENELNAIQAGMFMWEITLKPVSSIEEAKAHIEKMKLVKKMSNATINAPLFFISTAPEVGAINSSGNLDAALSNIPGDSKNLIRNAIKDEGEFFWIDQKGQVQKFDPTLVSDVPTEAIFHDDDGNGFAYNLSGWTLPVVRGVLHIKDAKASRDYNRRGKNYFDGVFDRKGNLQKEGLHHEGFYFKKNANLAGVLEKLRGMHRKGQSDNATRFIDPYNIALMQRLYEQNLLETHELYNKEGELIAGSIIVKIGKMWSPETVFYPSSADLHPGTDAPLSQNLDGIDYAKIVIAYTIDEAVKAGHSVLDTQVVSRLSEGFGARYENVDRVFIPLLHHTNEHWEENQKKLAEERAAEAAKEALIQEHYDALEEASSIAWLEARSTDLKDKIVVEKGKRKENLLHGDVAKKGERDPETIARIAAARTADKEQRRLERELDKVDDEINNLKARLLKEAEQLSFGSKAPEPTIEDARQALEGAKSKLEKATENIHQTEAALEAAQKAFDENSQDQTLQTQIEALTTRLAGMRASVIDGQKKVDKANGVVNRLTGAAVATE